MMELNGTLREKVYHFFCEELSNDNLLQGSYIDQNEICKKLNISRAPLRDALIQLEIEGFVHIQPRRGVLVKKVTLQDIKNAYEVIGTLESSVILAEFAKFEPEHIEKMIELNKELHATLENENFDEYYELNLDFHNVFLDFSENQLLKAIISPIKQRLCDFPRMRYNQAWERINLAEHQRFIDSINAGNREGAASIIKNEHWSFLVHKEHLIKVYRIESVS